MQWQFFALLSAFFASLVAIWAKIGLQGIDSDLATALRTVVIVLFAWAIVFYKGGHHQISQISTRGATFLVLSGLATGASWLCYFRALKLGEASRVAPLDKLSVAFTIFLAAIFLGEKLTLQTVAGAFLIVAGAIVLVLPGK